MSLPLYSLHCTQCDFSCPDDKPTRLHRHYLHDLGASRRAPSTLTRGWCSSCNSVVHAVGVPTRDQIDERLHGYTEELEFIEHRERLPGFELSLYDQAVVALYRTFLSSEAAWRAWASRHAGAAIRCLACDAEAQPLAFTAPSPSEQVADSTGWRHPGCSGLLARRLDMRVSLALPELPELVIVTPAFG